MLQPAVVHDRDPVAELDGLVDVVSHKDHRLSNFALNPKEFVLQAFSRDPVDGAKRFVHQQDRRVGSERAGDTDALALPARKLMGISAGELFRVEPHQFEQFGDTLLDPPLVPAQQPGHGRDIVGDAQVRKQSDVLDDVAHPQAERDRVDVRDVLLIVKDAAIAGLDEPVDHLERGRLSAAGRADQHGQLAGVVLDRQLPHRDLSARIALGDPFQSNH